MNTFRKFYFPGLISCCLLLYSSCATVKRQDVLKIEDRVTEVLRSTVMAQADWAMSQMPVTVTAASSARTAGGKHDFYSEGDYWWPDPADPNAPYVQRDGMTNPDNFVAHRMAMIRFSRIVGALASAYKISGEPKYVAQAMLHVKAWFMDKETRMNPDLQYAQAIKGRFTGRGIGIIDTIQLMEVAQGILLMEKAMSTEVVASAKQWFRRYLDWLMTHPYGKAEMEALNNHGTCFVMQVASFAKLTGDESLLSFCRERYKTVLLPGQMASDGSFPKELSRTKPYGYSIFNLDAMATICQLLSTEQDNLWTFESPEGRSIAKGIQYLSPYVADKHKWTLKPDVMYWADWPVAQPFLLFGAKAYQNSGWFDIWRKLDHDPKVEEVIRNLPVRNPLIWL
ncbi:alginate lyase family protein [Pedobacter sp. GR22-6]|uniref:alginate lyase family protein n=1 Tax=Pedobacter sp. GR22-6 TaxID=3127957 RepID=UPI00307D00EC